MRPFGFGPEIPQILISKKLKKEAVWFAQVIDIPLLNSLISPSVISIQLPYKISHLNLILGLALGKHELIFNVYLHCPVQTVQNL